MEQHLGESSGTRFPLRGYERAFTVADHGSVKTSYVMAIEGSNDALTALIMHLPQALVLTFNRHPRMRAMQVRGEFATAEIQPKITLETITEKKLLEIRVTEQYSQGKTWEQYAEAQANLPLDRFTELPYYFSVWHYPGESRVRLCMCSDHYMSDGVSSMAVLNDVVTFASELSREEQGQTSSQILAFAKEELPLRPSFLEMWLDVNSWSVFAGRMILKALRRTLLTAESTQFKPVIPLRADQADMSIPVKLNSSSILFAQGTPENMKSALQRCKEEGVTLFGALAAVAIAAFYVCCDDEEKRNSTSSPFKLGFEVVANMRNRVRAPVPEVQVGAYMLSNELASLKTEGVDMSAVSFWNLARKSRNEVDANFAGLFGPMRLLFADDFMNTNLTPEDLEGVHIPHSVSADLMISNIGKYAYPTTHVFQTGSPSRQLQDLKIESVHSGGSFPHTGTAVTLFVTSIDALSFGFMHKYEDTLGRKLFEAMIKGIERIGQVSRDETMAQVAHAVQQAL